MVAAAVVALAGVTPPAMAAGGKGAPTTGAPTAGAAATVDVRTVESAGLRVAVPDAWRVVDLARDPHACVRFDRPSLYLGAPGDQSECPAHVVGGAPALEIQRLSSSYAPQGPTQQVSVSGGHLSGLVLPSTGPVTFVAPQAGLAVTASYGPQDAELVRGVLVNATVTPAARAASGGSQPGGDTAGAGGFNVPGSLYGKGFDTCAAPSQAVMDAWWPSTDYAAIGVYIGGVSRGCAQPNLTASWVAQQVATGWHLMPTYVGSQAPCTRFRARVPYDPGAAFTLGTTEAQDAVAQATSLGIAAPSTIYDDMEGYNSGNQACVTAVLSYLSGWTHVLHVNGYQSGVYSSAASGIHDLSTHYSSPSYRRPDDVWIAWWNGRPDVDGGPYVPDGQWSSHRRMHQYVGNVTESHGGYTLHIDRDFLDVSWMVPPPLGCPANLNFTGYRPIGQGSAGPVVKAAQCLLARAGFDPGVATGFLGWRAAAAVRAFKASRGLGSSDAVLRRWVWCALISAGPTQFLHDGVVGLRVSKVQRALTARLGQTVPITGYYGSDTEDAVMEYQALVGLNVTGTVGVPTWRALRAGR